MLAWAQDCPSRQKSRLGLNSHMNLVPKNDPPRKQAREPAAVPAPMGSAPEVLVSRMRGGIFGALVGDSLGVPVEFQPRAVWVESLKEPEPS